MTKTGNPVGRPRTSTINRHVTCGLNKNLLATLDRLALELHTSRNRIMREALIEFAQRYQGLPASDPSLAHIKPHLAPPPADEDLKRLDSRVANLERWMVQAAQNAENAGIEIFGLETSREPSLAFRQAVERHDPSRKNVFVESATGPGGRR